MWVVAGVVGVVHLGLAAVPRRWFDEDLMLAIGRHHLDTGAVDQPPLTPLLARLADAVAPGSQVVLAVPAVVATVAAVLLTALMARELGGDRRAQTLGALAQGTGIAAAQFGHWLTPYTLEPALWSVLFWLLLRWVRIRDDRLLVVLGLVAGVTAQTRFQIGALGIVLLVALAVTGPRELLRRPALWLGAVLALLVASPALAWQMANGWPQLAMAGAVADENAAIYGGPVLVVLHGLAVVGPMALGLAVCGLAGLVRDPRLHPYRVVGVAFVLLFAAVAVSSGRHYYMLPMYPVLVALGVVALQHRREDGRRVRTAWPLVAAGTVLAVGGLASSVLLASPRFAEPLVSATAGAWQAIPAGQRDRTALGATPYVYATYLDAAPPERGLPPATSANRAYGWFPAPPEHQDRMLLVGDPDPWRPWFTGVRPVATAAAATPMGTYGGLVPESVTIWELDGRRAPWAEIRAALRDLHVAPGN
ncbi:hypothetical protein AFB00_21870 [Pseudonocardia sp. HH130630-07]|nr:hypothetical protein AFB00_21870 [Pseudonocardia sp. HH130630-07]